MSQNEDKKFRFRGRLIFFATNNVNKFCEARQVLRHYNLAVGMLRVKSPEIQSDSLEQIAGTSVVEAFERSRLPIIVEDAGLFVDGLNGFPGPYAAYAYRTIGNEGLLKLMKNVKDRGAQFKSAVAYMFEDLEAPVCFSGQVRGRIVNEEPRGSKSRGFGFDPIFEPVKCNRTFSEMSVSEKNRFSHRAKALRAFGKWYRALRRASSRD